MNKCAKLSLVALFSEKQKLDFICTHFPLLSKSCKINNSITKNNTSLPPYDVRGGCDGYDGNICSFGVHK